MVSCHYHFLTSACISCNHDDDYKIANIVIISSSWWLRLRWWWRWWCFSFGWWLLSVWPHCLAGRQLQLVETGFMILQKKFKGTGTTESCAKVPVDDWYPLVMTNSLLLKMTIYSGFSHWKRWFSIVMLVYQRVRLLKAVILRHFPTSWVRHIGRDIDTGHTVVADLSMA